MASKDSGSARAAEPTEASNTEPGFTLSLSSSLDPHHLQRYGYDAFDVFFGPATAVNMFSTCGFEKDFLDHFQRGNITRHKWFVGGSFGAYRFTALLGSILSETDHISPFHEHVINMTYKKGDTPEVLRPMLEDCRAIVASKDSIRQILLSTQFSFAVIVARFKPCVACCGNGNCLRVCLGCICVVNGCCQCIQRRTFERICFYTGTKAPDFFPKNHVAEYFPLTAENFDQVLQATAMIPGITVPVGYIENVGKGNYVDAALSNLHVGCGIANGKQGLVIAARPELYASIMDAYACCHQLPRSVFQNISVVQPTDRYREAVSPFEGEWKAMRQPTLDDWFDKDFVKHPEKRKRFWRRAKAVSELMWAKSMPMLRCGASKKL